MLYYNTKYKFNLKQLNIYIFALAIKKDLFKPRGYAAEFSYFAQEHREVIHSAKGPFRVVPYLYHNRSQSWIWAHISLW